MVLDVCDSHSRGSLGKLPHKGGAVRKWTVKECAEYLNVNVNTVYDLVRKGEIPHRNISKKCYRFDPEEVERWFDSLPQN